MPFNWSPLWLSLRVAGLGTAGALLPGLWLAYVLATRRFAGRSAAFALLSLLLATPVVICAWLFLGPSFSWKFAAAAGVLAAIPLIALGARYRLQSLDLRYGNAARSLGASEWRIFWSVMLPLGWRPTLAAAAVAFARVLAEWTIVGAL
jgi:molybdate transport system permease protein